MLSILAIIVIAAASFAPHPLRGWVILAASAFVILHTVIVVSPFEQTPDTPQAPSVDEAEDMIERNSIEKANFKK